MNAGTGDLKPVLDCLAEGKTLSEAQAEQIFEVLMAGNATPAQTGAILMALRVRGETVEEITGAARALRARALHIKAPDGAVDTCGTGGDKRGTYNISTAVAFVVAATGVPVAKHGNRALSSHSGAADVLSALGVNIDCPMEVVERALHEIGITFLMAPRHHAAMRNVSGTRVELGTRTIFNLLGPLINPAGAKRQLMGVFARHWLEPLAEVLGRLGSEQAWVVHGSDGLDEITTTGPTHVASYQAGRVKNFLIDPLAFGIELARPEDLKGGDAATNAEALRAVLSGAKGPHRDIVLLNAAAVLVVAGRSGDLASGLVLAAAAVDEGAALSKLECLIAMTGDA